VEGVWKWGGKVLGMRTEVPSRVKGWSPVGDLGTKLSKAETIYLI